MCLHEPEGYAIGVLLGGIPIRLGRSVEADKGQSPGPPSLGAGGKASNLKL